MRPRRSQAAGGATSQAEHTTGARADARSDRAGASLTLARLAALGPLAERRGSLEKVVLSPISGGHDQAQPLVFPSLSSPHFQYKYGGRIAICLEIMLLSGTN